MGGGHGRPVSETGSERKALERSEIGEEDATEVETLVGGFGLVPLDERTAIIIIHIFGRGIPVTGHRILHDVLALLISLQHTGGELAGIGIIHRSQRVDREDGTEHGAITALLGNTFGLPAFHGCVDTDLNPVIELVVSIDLGAETGVLVLISNDDTVVSEVVERDEEMSLVVSALEREGVLGRERRFEDHVEPVGVGSVVLIGSQGALHIDTGGLLIGNPFLRAEDLRLFTKGLMRHLEVIGDA